MAEIKTSAVGCQLCLREKPRQFDKPLLTSVYVHDCLDEGRLIAYWFWVCCCSRGQVGGVYLISVFKRLCPISDCIGVRDWVLTLNL